DQAVEVEAEEGGVRQGRPDGDARKPRGLQSGQEVRRRRVHEQEARGRTVFHRFAEGPVLGVVLAPIDADERDHLAVDARLATLDELEDRREKARPLERSGLLARRLVVAAVTGER